MAGEFTNFLTGDNPKFQMEEFKEFNYVRNINSSGLNAASCIVCGAVVFAYYDLLELHRQWHRKEEK
jgi:hypothetical protein